MQWIATTPGTIAPRVFKFLPPLSAGAIWRIDEHGRVNSDMRPSHHMKLESEGISKRYRCSECPRGEIR